MNVVKLKELSINNRGYYGIGAPAINYDKNKFVYLRITDIKDDGEINKDSLMSVEDSKASQYILEKNDIVFARTGASTGRNYFYDGEIQNMVYAGFLIKFSLNSNLVNPRYVKYYCLSPKYKDWIYSSLTGSTRPNINEKQLSEMPIELPERTYQDKVVKILDSITKKIELNNKTNNNLCELSYEVFKNFKEEIKKQPIKEFCDFKELGSIIMGQSPKGESYNFDNVGIPLINGAADYQNGYLKPQKYTSMPTKVCKKGDLIFCIRATIGLLVVSNEEYCLGRGVAGIINTYDYYKEYVYHLINNSINEFKRMATGSVIVGISRDDIGNMKVSVPSEEQIIEFHTVQKPIFDKIENIREENKTLVQLRDTLLPKLMNGEIDLDNIEI